MTYLEPVMFSFNKGRICFHFTTILHRELYILLISGICIYLFTYELYAWVLTDFYVLLIVQLDAILGNDQLDALFLNVFILCLYMFRAASAHHHEVQIVLMHHLV
jgi:hypothetical protein